MTLTVEEVEGRRLERAFLNFPYSLYRELPDSRWIPPLKRTAREALDTRRHPFYREGRLRRFLAIRDGQVQGRIAAILNPAHNRYHNEETGFFGFFECSDDPEAAGSLLDAAAGALEEWKLNWMRGPVSPSTIHESGLLVGGFSQPPVLLTTWNPAYYVRLLTDWGLVVEKNLLGFRIPAAPVDERESRGIRQLADRARRQGRLSVREVSLRRFATEAEILWDIYSGAWSGNWGFSPPSREEFLHLGRDLRSIMNPRLALVAEEEGQPVGFFLAVPDLNRVLHGHWSGRLFPGGILRIMRDLPSVRSVRILAMGVKQGHRKRGVLPLLLDEAMRRGLEWGATWGEASWILEDNTDVIRAIEVMGGEEYRRWQLLGAPLPRAPSAGGE